MIDVLAAARGLAAAVTAADGQVLRGSALATDSPAVPCVIVPLPEVEYLQTGDGSMKATYTLRFLAGPRQPDEIGPQERLARWVTPGTGSIIAGIEADQTLDGSCDSVTVLSAARPGVYEYGNSGEFIGMELTVEVIG